MTPRQQADLIQSLAVGQVFALRRIPNAGGELYDELYIRAEGDFHVLIFANDEKLTPVVRRRKYSNRPEDMFNNGINILPLSVEDSAAVCMLIELCPAEVMGFVHRVLLPEKQT